VIKGYKIINISEIK